MGVEKRLSFSKKKRKLCENQRIQIETVAANLLIICIFIFMQEKMNYFARIYWFICVLKQSYSHVLTFSYCFSYIFRPSSSKRQLYFLPRYMELYTLPSSSDPTYSLGLVPVRRNPKLFASVSTCSTRNHLPLCASFFSSLTSDSSFPRFPLFSTATLTMIQLWWRFARLWCFWLEWGIDFH